MGEFWKWLGTAIYTNNTLMHSCKSLEFLWSHKGDGGRERGRREGEGGGGEEGGRGGWREGEGEEGGRGGWREGEG